MEDQDLEKEFDNIFKPLTDGNKALKRILDFELVILIISSISALSVPIGMIISSTVVIVVGLSVTLAGLIAYRILDRQFGKKVKQIADILPKINEKITKLVEAQSPKTN